MARITAIIFDLDGTLYTSKGLAAEIHRVACGALARQLGVTADEADNRLRETKALISTRTGREATLSAACAELGCDIRELHRYLATEIAPEPFLLRDDQVVAMLARLSGTRTLYVYTNNNRPLATRIMAAIGVDTFIRKTFSIEDLWRSKPDRMALESIFADIGAQPRECLFAGDRYDVDLRLPAELGSTVFLTRSVAELLTLEQFIADNGS